MSLIQLREGAGVVSIYKLDSCGQAGTTTDGRLVLDGISEFGWEDVINDGDEITERNFAGKLCFSDTGANELRNVGVNMTACGIIPAIDQFVMGSQPILDGTEVTGYGRRDLKASTAVAVEVMLKLEADACAGGATAAPVATWLFPLVKNWKPAGGATLNGTDLVKPQYSGQNFKNTKIFEGGVPTVLAHWDGVLSAANDWYAFNLFDPSVETTVQDTLDLLDPDAGGYDEVAANGDPIDYA